MSRLLRFVPATLAAPRTRLEPAILRKVREWPSGSGERELESADEKSMEFRSLVGSLGKNQTCDPSVNRVLCEPGKPSRNVILHQNAF